MTFASARIWSGETIPTRTVAAPSVVVATNCVTAPTAVGAETLGVLVARRAWRVRDARSVLPREGGAALPNDAHAVPIGTLWRFFRLGVGCACRLSAACLLRGI